MAKRIGTRGGVYLYAVVGGSENRSLGAVGLFGSDVFMVAEGDVSAVISEIPSADKLRPERRHLAAHQGVLSRLVQEGLVVLPVSFGTIAESMKAIHEMLNSYQKDLGEQVKRVDGNVEMEVRVTFDVPNVFEYFVSIHPELRELRDRVFDKKHEPTRDEKIELGQLFERLLGADREELTRKVEKALSKHTVDIKRNKCRNEQEVMRLSCLVPRDEAGEFEKPVSEASELFDDHFTFEYSGPFPPYNFVEVHIRMRGKERSLAA